MRIATVAGYVEEQAAAPRDPRRRRCEAPAGRGVVFTPPPEAMPWGLSAIFTDPESSWLGLRKCARAPGAP